MAEVTCAYGQVESLTTGSPQLKLQEPAKPRVIVNYVLYTTLTTLFPLPITHPQFDGLNTLFNEEKRKEKTPALLQEKQQKKAYGKTGKTFRYISYCQNLMDRWTDDEGEL